MMVLSRLPDRTNLPSGENATHVTWSICPLKVEISLPAGISHSLTDISQPPDAAFLPSGEKATAATRSSWDEEVVVMISGVAQLETPKRESRMNEMSLPKTRSLHPVISQHHPDML